MACVPKVGVLLASALVGCGAASHAPRVMPAGAPTPTPAPIARWLTPPPRSLVGRAHLDLATGVLVVGDAGARWTEREGAVPESSLWAIHDDLRAVWREGARFAFLGASGTIYVADEPLGPIVETRATLAGAHAIARGRAVLVAATRSGEIARSSDGGRSWSNVVSADRGAFASVALAPSGIGLALAFPQRVLVTRDDGATWSPISAAGAHGTTRVLADASDTLLLVDAEAEPPLRLVLEPSPRFARSDEMPFERGPQFPPRTDRHHDVRARRLDGGRVVELVAWRPVLDRVGWKLGVRGIAQTGERRAIPLPEECDDVDLAARGDFVAALCREGMKHVLYRSFDAGVTWRSDALAGCTSLTGAALDGTLLLGGCPSHQILPAGASVPVPASVGAGEPLSARIVDTFVTAADGTLHALVQGERYALYDVRGDAPMKRLAELDLDARAAARAAITTGDAPIWAVGSRAGRGTVIHARIDGTITETVAMPFAPREIALAGERGLALDAGARVWETVDRGRIWRSIAELSSVRDEHVTCSAGGCLIGSRERAGWAFGPTAPPPAPAKPGPAAPDEPVRWATPLRCTAAGPWIEGARPSARARPRDGGGLVLRTLGPTVSFTASSDGGATSHERTWSLAPPWIVDQRTHWDTFVPRPGDVQLGPDVQLVEGWPGAGRVFVAYWTEDAGASFVGWAVPWVDAPDPPAPTRLPTQATLGDPPRACDAAARTWPRVVIPWSNGTRHPVLVEGERFRDAPLVLSTARVHARVSGEQGCADELEAWPGGFGNPYSARIPAADPAHSWLTRGTAKRRLACRFEHVVFPEHALEEIDTR